MSIHCVIAPPEHPTDVLKPYLEGSNSPTEEQWTTFVNSDGSNGVNIADEIASLVADGTITAENSKNLVKVLKDANVKANPSATPPTTAGVGPDKAAQVIKGLGKAYATAKDSDDKKVTAEGVKGVANSVMTEYFKANNKGAKFNFGNYKAETEISIVPGKDKKPDTLVFGKDDKKVSFALSGLPDDVSMSVEDGDKLYAVTSTDKGGKKFESRNTGDDVIQKIVDKKDLDSLPSSVKTENFEFWKVENVDNKKEGFVAIGYSKVHDGKEGSVTIEGSKITSTGIANAKVINDEKNRVSLTSCAAEVKNDDTLTLLSGGDKTGPAKVVKTVDGISVAMEYKNDRGNEKGSLTLLTGEYSTDLGSKRVLAFKESGEKLELSGDVSSFNGGSLRVDKPDDQAVTGSIQCGKTSYSTETTPLDEKEAKGKNVIWTGDEGTSHFEIKNGNVNVPATLSSDKADVNSAQAQAQATAVQQIFSDRFQKVETPINGVKFSNVYSLVGPDGQTYYFTRSADGSTYYGHGTEPSRLKAGDTSTFNGITVNSNGGYYGGPSSSNANGGCRGGSCGGCSGGRCGWVPGQPVRNVLRAGGRVLRGAGRVINWVRPHWIFR